MHPFVFDALVRAKVDELQRQARRDRLADSVRRPSVVAQATGRSVRAFGFLLVGAGLRLAVVGGQGRAGRSVR